MKVNLIEMFCGGGTLTHAMHKGLTSAGCTVNVSGLFELDTRYLGVSSRAHPEASTWNASVSVWHPAELSVPTDGSPVVFVAGIPCTGASRAGISKNGLSAPEEHPDVGHLFLPTIHFIRAHRPDVAVFENVDSYAKTLSARCLRSALEQAGYRTEERVVNPFTQFGAPVRRLRWVLVATRTPGFRWVFSEEAFAGTLDTFLDAPGPQDDEDSATPEQVAADSAYCNRKAAEGCGFAMTLIDRASRKCPTIPKSYGKRQPTGTFVRTPKSYRMLRPREIARLHGFAENLFADLPRTQQYEMLGQGVVCQPFASLGASIAAHLRGEVAAPVGQMELFA